MTHEVDYFEIGSSDPAKSKAFYEGLFGWTVEPPSEPVGYSMVDEGRGGLWRTTELGNQNWAIFYVRVDDAAVARAEELGATVAVPVIDNGQIHFAHIVDPLGNRLGVWRPND